MRYGKLPQKFLDIIVREDYVDGYGFYDITLGQILEEDADEIICCEYDLETNTTEPKFSSFVAWTETKVYFMVDTGIGSDIVAVPRHPHSFIYKHLERNE